MRKAVALATLLTGVSCSFARAETNCIDALVQDVYKSSSDARYDYRFAQYLTQTQYDALGGESNAEGIIYGIPVKGGFSAYHQNATTLATSTNTAISSADATTLLYTALDPYSAIAYTACLSAIASQKPGLHVFLQPDTGTGEATVELRWNPSAGPGAVPIKLSYHPVKAPEGATTYPISLGVNGSKFVTFPRPDKAFDFYAQGTGANQSVSEIVRIGPTVAPITGCKGHFSGEVKYDGFYHLVCRAHFGGKRAVITRQNIRFSASPDLHVTAGFGVAVGDSAYILPAAQWKGPITDPNSLAAEQSATGPLTDDLVPITIYVNSCWGDGRGPGVEQCHLEFDWSLY